MAKSSSGLDHDITAAEFNLTGTAERTEKSSSSSLSREMVMDFVAATEALIVAICAVLAKLIYVNNFLGGSQPELSYFGVGLAGALFCFFIMGQRGHYSPESLTKKNKQTSRIFRSLMLAFFLLLALGYFLKVSDEYSRGWIMTWFALSFIILSIERKLVISTLRKLTHNGFFSKQVVLFGAEPLCGQFRKRLQDSGAEINIVKTFCVKGLTEQGGFMEKAFTAQLHALVEFGRAHRFDQILVALPSNGGAHVQEIMLELGQLPVAIDVVPGEAALYIRQPTLSTIGDLGLYNIQRKPITGWGSVAKRIFDLAVSLPALVVLSPLMLLIAAAIKITSRGKVFFIQERHGLNEQIIKVMKFRTMSVAESGASAEQAKKNDSRITGVGKILRKTSLDELPQLINVVKGNMSLVGPRPHPIKLNKDHAHLVHSDDVMQKLHHYASRHNVKPGITGWAQVKGFRGETDTTEKMAKRVQHDLYYIHNWTIWMDLRILRKTVLVVIKGENAG